MKDDALHDQIVQALRTIYDPEIHVNIYDLGLIYAVNEVDPGIIEIDMTLTSPGCPVAGSLPGEVEQAVLAVGGVSKCSISLVWDPPWSMDLITDEVKLDLGLL